MLHVGTDVIVPAVPNPSLVGTKSEQIPDKTE